MTYDVDWRNYVNEKGEFELPFYLYRVIYGLMKNALDLGTLLSEDERRLKAYRDRVKATFKNQWLQIAQSLEHFGLIQPCGCALDDFCSICGGSRYVMDTTFNEDEVREVFTVLSNNADDETAVRLKQELASLLGDIYERESSSDN